MTKLDELITAAKKQRDEAKAGTDERTRAEYRVSILEEMKTEHKFGPNQDEVNGVVKKAEESASEKAQATGEKWAELMGMPYDEAESALQDLDESTLQSLAEFAPSGESGEDGSSESGDGDEEGQNPVLTTLQQAVTNLQAQNKEIRDQNAGFQQKILSDRVSGGLASALKEQGLQDKYLEPAKRMSGFDALLKDAMDGKEPDASRYKEIAENLASETPPWFTPERDPNLAGVDFTPPAGEIPTLTDEQRAEVSAPVF